MPFRLAAPFQPTGDQPQAIEKLVSGVKNHQPRQVLLGVTGSGKTYTMAQVIEKTQLPTLVVAHNKTLAAQLYQEFREFFPDAAVSYFVSYYDYYQPEAYIPTTDTYIEKEATINDEIDKLRLAATTNLLTRPDCIVVASVSCIYNLGSPVEYGRFILELIEGEVIARNTLLLSLTNLQYDRSEYELKRGTYRVRGDTIHVWPAYEDRILAVTCLDQNIEKLVWVEPTSLEPIKEDIKSGPRRIILYPAKHYMVDPVAKEKAIKKIETDLAARLAVMNQQGKQLEALRLKQKVNYDLNMIREFGFVNGIENYSIYFDGRQPGDPPYTLLEYFKASAQEFKTGGFLTFIDESHMTIPQIRGMHHGDKSRKETLIGYGFRLPSALDNRPLQLNEFEARVPLAIAVSATPAEYEVAKAKGHVVEQLVRPTGLVDPLIELRPTTGQIEDLIFEIMLRKLRHERVLVTTLTKKTAESLTEYLNDPAKITKLLNQAISEYHLDRQRQSQVDEGSKLIRWNKEELPVDQMPIGRIETQYYRHLEFLYQPQISQEISQLTAVAMPKVAYIHADVETLERSEKLAQLRSGEFDVLVGINLLREGLDLPEVSLVAILDADKEGFLRSTTSLVQTMGRAARHVNGLVILYATNLTGSMQTAVSETTRRRLYQQKYNQDHHITPTSINKPIRSQMVKPTPQDDDNYSKHSKLVKLKDGGKFDLTQIDPADLTPHEKKSLRQELTTRMRQAAKDLDFEQAAYWRDKVQELENNS